VTLEERPEDYHPRSPEGFDLRCSFSRTRLWALSSPRHRRRIRSAITTQCRLFQTVFLRHSSLFQVGADFHWRRLLARSSCNSLLPLYLKAAGLWVVTRRGHPSLCSLDNTNIKSSTSNASGPLLELDPPFSLRKWFLSRRLA